MCNILGRCTWTVKKNVRQKKQMYNCFINSNNYVLLSVWIHCGKTNMEKLEKINKRALKFVANSDNMNYNDLLEQLGQSFPTIHIQYVSAYKNYS